MDTIDKWPYNAESLKAAWAVGANQPLHSTCEAVHLPDAGARHV